MPVCGSRRREYSNRIAANGRSRSASDACPASIRACWGLIDRKSRYFSQVRGQRTRRAFSSRAVHRRRNPLQQSSRVVRPVQMREHAGRAQKERASVGAARRAGGFGGHQCGVDTIFTFGRGLLELLLAIHTHAVARSRRKREAFDGPLRLGEPAVQRQYRMRP